MPESRGRKKPKPRNQDNVTIADKPGANPPWFVPVMVTLMILGVLWVSIFYITQGDLPIRVGYWNLVIGLGLVMGGFVMATRWR